MDHRLDSIQEAHKKTFEWIFKDSTSEEGRRIQFLDWLESGHGIYWINGKAGSGKSTLMKFLGEHEKTAEALRAWAGGKRLAVAHHYFWNAGTPLQKSQKGLFQSLLYQILHQVPELIPQVSPLHWEKYLSGCSSTSSEDSWTWLELRKAFKSLKCQLVEPVRLCFFIDGLDEYEGDQLQLVDAIVELASSVDLKLCVSSRPWNVFEAAFGKTLDQQLVLQDLTRKDIALYVQSKLERINAELEDYKSLVDEITRRAEGVFLWVSLVMRSLQEGILNGDSASMLRKRVRKLPTDLRAYFRRMLHSTEEVYREETARILLIRLGWQRIEEDDFILEFLSWACPPCLLMMSHFDRQGNFAKSIKMDSMTDQDVSRRLQKAQWRVKARCKDLLEFGSCPCVMFEDNSTTPQKNCRSVDFSHRTIHELVKTEEVQTMLHGWIKRPFNVHEYWCNAVLARLKAVGRKQLRKTSAVFETLYLLPFMSHATLLERRTNKPATALIKNMFLTCNTLRQVNILPHRSWSLNTLDFSFRSWKPGEVHFIKLAMVFGTYLYISNKINEDPCLVHQIDEVPTLILALLPVFRVGWHLGCYSVDIPRLLLSKGADPNQLCEGRSIWAQLLESISARNTKVEDGDDISEDRQLWAVLIELFILHGADPDLIIRSSKTVPEIISGVCLPEDADRLHKLVVEKKTRFGFWKLLGWK